MTPAAFFLAGVCVAVVAVIVAAKHLIIWAGSVLAGWIFRSL